MVTIGLATESERKCFYLDWITERCCGAVRFEVDAPRDLLVYACNCSICSMTGFLHLIVPAARFRLLTSPAALSSYSFNTGVAKHLFCRTCGIKSFYVPRSHPDGYSVNVRCIDPGTIERVELELFDDNDRRAAEARFRDRSQPD